jgi:O-antigen/teichoic acid export membrane protein
MTSIRSVLASFAVILLDLAGRAGLDKVIALIGTPALIAQWAQLQSVVELIGGIALVGISGGLTVMIAQAKTRPEQAGLLRAALRLTLAIALTGALIFLTLSPLFRGYAVILRIDLLAVAVTSGCLAVFPGLMSAYWLGLHRQDRVLKFSLLNVLPMLAVALTAYQSLALQNLLLAQCATLALIALPMGGYLMKLSRHAEHRKAAAKLMRFIPVGLAIGIMSPASMLVMRGVIASTLSWDDAGMLQALWRLSEWVTGIASGVLLLVFLPRLSATFKTPQFLHELRRAALVVLSMAAFLFVLIFLNQRALLAALYDARFSVSDSACALFMLGSWIRVASWVFLYGLYATHRTWLIAAGEILSLPLLVFLLWLYRGNMSLELISLLYCATYVVYAAFNAAALFCSRPQQAKPA